MKNIPESKKAELLKALQTVVGKIEEIEEEAKATQDTPAEHSLPAEKHDKTFVMAMEVFDDSEKTGKALSCNGIVGKQIELVCDIIEQIAKACDERPIKIVSDITRRMLMCEMFDKEEATCD